MVNTLVVFIVGITGLLAFDYFKNGSISLNRDQNPPTQVVVPATVVDEVQSEIAVDLPAFKIEPSLSKTSLNRVVMLTTEIPVRARVDVITYTVELGDSLFSIADDFGLKAETVLWGNFELLEDNPHLLKTGQNLNILPTNGTYYEWHENDNLAHVADFFKVDPQAIIEQPITALGTVAQFMKALSASAPSYGRRPAGRFQAIPIRLLFTQPSTSAGRLEMQSMLSITAWLFTQVGVIMGMVI